MVFVLFYFISSIIIIFISLEGWEEVKESTFLLWSFTGRGHSPSGNDQGLPGAGGAGEALTVAPRGQQSCVGENECTHGKCCMYSDGAPMYGSTKEGHPAQPGGL